MLLLGVFVVLALLAALLTGWVRHYAVVRLLDIPNARSSHTRPTPRGGGLAIVIVLGVAGLLTSLFGLIPSSLQWALTACIPLAVVGFIDDHGDVPARWRFLVQIISAAFAVYAIGGLELLHIGGVEVQMGALGSILGILFMVWMLNLFNFMDGIDGIEATEVIFVALGASFLMGVGLASSPTSEMVVGVAMAGATTGFLFWNWPPARIFMGDVGSGVLGFMLALLMLHSAVSGSLTLCVWVILSGVFLVDATLTLMIRLLRRERWYEAHRSHAYQHASRLFGSHRTVTLAVLAINLFWLFPMAWTAHLRPDLEVMVVVVALLPLAYAGFRLGAGRP